MSGSKFTYVSLFAGCGGSSLGYEMAGGKCLAAIDFDDLCEKTYKKNFPKTRFIKEDVSEIDAGDLMSELGIKRGELDILDSSPPCQGFSVLRNREVSDPRNSLGWEVVRITEEMRPKAFLLENVETIAYGSMRGIPKMLYNDFSAAGYKVRAKIMDASYYGVPQKRRRFIMVGIRDDVRGKFEFPAREKGYTTAKEAIGGMDISKEEVVLPTGRALGFVKQLRWGERGKKYDKDGSFYGLMRLHPNRPSYTIVATFSDGAIGIFHWDEDRYLTIKEIKVLSSFPDGFKLAGNFEEQWHQIGNAVMPLFLKPIAEAIYKAIKNPV